MLGLKTVPPQAGSIVPLCSLISLGETHAFVLQLLLLADIIFLYFFLLIMNCGVVGCHKLYPMSDFTECWSHKYSSTIKKVN